MRKLSARIKSETVSTITGQNPKVRLAGSLLFVIFKVS